MSLGHQATVPSSPWYCFIHTRVKFRICFPSHFRRCAALTRVYLQSSIKEKPHHSSIHRITMIRRKGDIGNVNKDLLLEEVLSKTSGSGLGSRRHSVQSFVANYLTNFPQLQRQVALLIQGQIMPPCMRRIKWSSRLLQRFMARVCEGARCVWLNILCNRID